MGLVARMRIDVGFAFGCGGGFGLGLWSGAVGDETEEILVDGRVVGQFGMEGGGQDMAFLD